MHLQKKCIFYCVLPTLSYQVDEVIYMQMTADIPGYPYNTVAHNDSLVCLMRINPLNVIGSNMQKDLMLNENYGSERLNYVSESISHKQYPWYLGSSTTALQMDTRTKLP